MKCRIGDLKDKEVINMRDGTRLGFVGDAEFDSRSASLTALVILGRLRLFGLFGREADIVIPWENVSLIGDDTVLVHWDPPREERRTGTLGKVLEKLNF